MHLYIHYGIFCRPISVFRLYIASRTAVVCTIAVFNNNVENTILARVNSFIAFIIRLSARHEVYLRCAIGCLDVSFVIHNTP